MKVLDVLAWRLDFDCNSPNSHDNVQRIPMEAIVREARVKLPDCSRRLDHGNLSYVRHDIDICQIDDMLETSVEED